MGCFGLLWIVVGHYGSFWVVPRSCNYEYSVHLIQKRLSSELLHCALLHTQTAM